ncbi:MAG: 4Fe-4S dicluster domain-containing protein [Desulfocucumaceae bacterium]
MTGNTVSSEPFKYDTEFAKEIYSLENGHYIKLCMQCGMCEVSCATRKEMDYSPRKMFLLIRAGKREEFFRSNTMWMCSTCLMCRVRCPRGIPLMDVMHDLKCHSIKLGYTDRPQASFYQAFWQEIWSRGKMFEGGLMARYYLKRGWREIKGAFAMKDLGMDMLKHSRMPLMPPKSIKGLKDVRVLVERAKAQVQKGEDR